LRQDESTGKDAVILYSANKYGVLDLYDYTARVAGLEDQPRYQLKEIAETQKKA
jgi:hypothetical protein